MVGVISHFVLLGLVVACHGQAYLKNCVNDTDPRPTPDVSIRILPSTTIIDRSTVWITCEASARQSSDDEEIQPLPPTRIEIYVGLYSVNTCTGSPVTRCSYRILSFFYGIPRLVACVASAAPGQCRYTYRIINIVKRNEGCPDPTGRCPTQPEDSCNDDFDCLPTQRCCLQATCRQDKICLRAEITKPSTTRATTTPTTEATTTPTTEATTTPTTEATTTPTTLTTETVTTTEETTPSEKITVAPLTDASTAIPTTKEEHPEKMSSTTPPPDLSTVATTTKSTTMVPTHSKRKGDKDNSDDEDSDDEDDDDDDDDDSDENDNDDDDD